MPCSHVNPTIKHLALSTLLAAWMGWIATAQATPFATPTEAQKQAIQQLDEFTKRIQNFHHEVRTALLETVANPLFTAYFSLEESRQNRYSADGVLQLTQRQIGLREEIEALVMEQHKLFPISETCLVDRHGQEHMRAMNDRAEQADHFSDSEGSSPFFEPTMALHNREIHISNPYVSPDSHEWVVAFTSPILLKSGEHVAFLHMEIPLMVYHILAIKKDFTFSSGKHMNLEEKGEGTEEGRFFIIDQKGRILADSRKNINFKSKRYDGKPYFTLHRPPEVLQDYTPLMSSISNDVSFTSSIKGILTEQSGWKHLKIAGRDYVMVYRQFPDQPWVIIHLDPVGTSPDGLTGWASP